MNKPTPAIDENGEFVVATQRDGGRVVIYTLRSDADQIVGEYRWWHLDGASICRSKPGYDLIDLDKVRATVERARRTTGETVLPPHRVCCDQPEECESACVHRADYWRAKCCANVVGKPMTCNTTPIPRKPSFAEALEAEYRRKDLFVEAECIARARRASEGP